MKTPILLSAVALALSACAAMDMETPPQSQMSYNAPDPNVRPAPPVEEALTTGDGMTLYVFDKDVPGSGKSACNGPCAANWPPQPAGDDSKPFGKYTVVKRDDGTKQWAYNGRPLYTWSKDKKPGDRSGDNFNNVWHVAKP
jgi:predicted lipoprotein with Yx(FWY)xxD motif